MEDQKWEKRNKKSYKQISKIDSSPLSKQNMCCVKESNQRECVRHFKASRRGCVRLDGTTPLGLADLGGLHVHLGVCGEMVAARKGTIARLTNIGP